MHRKHKAILAAAVLIALAAVYFLFNPYSSRFFPKCLFRELTGWKCPGCGSQRSFHSMLHGDIAAALTMNIWLPFASAYVALIVMAMLFSDRKSRFTAAVTNKYLFFAFLLFTLLWFVLRNICGV
ncbi:MAG: DUF2752 domain-containing protein [Prevotellaceae bacterium]|nr:DUF2752 domain-containing protein [Prevotellaceae bacterium]